MHRLGLAYQKPKIIPRNLDVKKQQGFIAKYEELLNSLTEAEAVLFVDAVHPTYATRPVGCWAPKEEALAIEQTSGRQRIKFMALSIWKLAKLGSLKLKVLMLAQSTVRLFESIEYYYPYKQRLHVFLDNARYHHARIVSEWLSRPSCRITLNLSHPIVRT